MSRVLAITFDGLLQPLGYSQVARVVIGLAARGYRYTVLSLERDAHLANHAHAQHVRRLLERAGVEWITGRYEEGGGPAIASNLGRVAAAASRLALRRRFDLVHARAFHSAMAARLLRSVHGTPYLFDVRGYWVDEQVQEGRRFQGSRSYRAAKAIERRLFDDAAGIVTLTSLQKSDIVDGSTGARRERPVACIPTCADYEEFRLADAGTPAPDFLRDLPDGARTVAIVGSMNRSYHVDETLELARMLVARDPRWYLVVLSSQCEEYERAIAAAGIPPHRVRIASVPHHRMPEVLPHLEWGLLLLRESFAKRGSMPTKLAEFLASGVAVVQVGCNSEVSEWVRRTGAGLVLGGTTPRDLSAAAELLSGGPRTAADRETSRALSAQHFSLRSGVERYAALLEQLRAAR